MLSKIFAFSFVNFVEWIFSQKSDVIHKGIVRDD